METETTPPNSMSNLLIMTKQGRMLLGMGFLYTVIVSLSMAVFYFTAGGLVTVVAGSGYILITSALVYTRTPSAKLIPAAFLVFTVIPMIVAIIGILTGIVLL